MRQKLLTLGAGELGEGPMRDEAPGGLRNPMWIGARTDPTPRLMSRRLSNDDGNRTMPLLRGNDMVISAKPGIRGVEWTLPIEGWQGVVVPRNIFDVPSDSDSLLRDSFLAGAKICECLGDTPLVMSRRTCW